MGGATEGKAPVSVLEALCSWRYAKARPTAAVRRVQSCSAVRRVLTTGACMAGRPGRRGDRPIAAWPWRTMRWGAQVELSAAYGARADPHSQSLACEAVLTCGTSIQLLWITRTAGITSGAALRSPTRRLSASDRLQRWLVHQVGSASSSSGTPISTGSRCGYGREIGPRCRGPQIAP